MLKRIYSYIIILAASVPIFISCDSDEDGIERYSSLIDVSSSDLLKEDKFHVALQFSTDDGVTFKDYRVLPVGKKYKVRVIKREITGNDTVKTQLPCIEIDWSGSDPKPNGDAITNIAEFTANGSNQVVAKVTGNFLTSPYDASAWAGTISAYEDYGSSHWGPYETSLTQDPSNSNRFHLDNFYDSGLDAYIEFDGATGTVKFPNQTVDGKPITNSSGTFDQCRRQVTIKLNYDGGDWTYLFGQH